MSKAQKPANKPQQQPGKPQPQQPQPKSGPKK